MKHYKTYIIGVLSIILYKLCVFYLIFVVFVSGIATVKSMFEAIFDL